MCAVLGLRSNKLYPFSIFSDLAIHSTHLFSFAFSSDVSGFSLDGKSIDKGTNL